MLVLDEVDKLYLSVMLSETNEFTLQENEKLYEKLYDINSHDISIILPYLRNFYDSLNDLNYFDIASKAAPVLLQVIDSGELTSQECKSAHALNPIDIRVYSICQPLYAPQKGYIQVGLPSLLSSLLLEWVRLPNYNRNFKNSLENILDKNYISDKDKAYIKSTFTEDFILQTFYHELSHWLSDTLHNRHIMKAIDKSNINNKSLAQHYKTSNMIFSPIEVDAYMHGLYSTYKLLGKDKWNTLTLDDLFTVYPALQSIESNKNEKAIINFKKALISRLSREGILGNNMRY
jgi:hypothetical protein